MTDQTPVDINFKDGQMLRVTGTLSLVEHYSTKPDRPAEGRVWASGRLAHALGDVTLIFSADLLDSDPHLAHLITRGYPIGVDVTARLETWGFDPAGPELIPSNHCQLWAVSAQPSAAQISIDAVAAEAHRERA